MEPELPLGCRRPRGRARALAAGLGQGRASADARRSVTRARALSQSGVRSSTTTVARWASRAGVGSGRNGARPGGRAHRGARPRPGALLEQGALLEAAGAAARFALENERLQAGSASSSTRCARREPGSSSRRRRAPAARAHLHDGAQQRLLGLGLALQLVRAKLGAEANGAVELLAEADAELRAALDELRELARGIHPAVLTEQGLGVALARRALTGPGNACRGSGARLAGAAEAAVPRLGGACQRREARGCLASA